MLTTVNQVFQFQGGMKNLLGLMSATPTVTMCLPWQFARRINLNYVFYQVLGIFFASKQVRTGSRASFYDGTQNGR